jgi:hypothetical protein
MKRDARIAVQKDFASDHRMTGTGQKPAGPVSKMNHLTPQALSESG